MDENQNLRRAALFLPYKTWIIPEERGPDRGITEGNKASTQFGADLVLAEDIDAIRSWSCTWMVYVLDVISGVERLKGFGIL